MNLRVGRNLIEITHPDRELFPEAGLNKADLASYYHRVAPWMLPHLKDRPLTLERYPKGIEQDGFFQQQATESLPDYLSNIELPRKSGGTITHAVCNNAAALVYLAQLGVITLHQWLSRSDLPSRPDRLIFDLDPPGSDFFPVRRAAARLRELLFELGLICYPMTTGSHGLHLIVPLDRRAGFDQVRRFAHAVASYLARRYPDELTVEQREAQRAGRLYIDVFRNSYGQTGVAPFTIRPRPRAPVATPLSWDELDRPELRADSYTVANIFRRLGQKGDPWKGLGKHRRSLAKAEKLMARLDSPVSGSPEE